MGALEIVVDGLVEFLGILLGESQAGLLEEARRHLVLRADLPITVPVRLIHGMADPDVPWRTSLRLAERLGADVVVTLIKDGDHRLARAADLARLTAAVDELSGAG